MLNIKNATYEGLITEAIKRLENNDQLYVNMIDELDNWNGFADGFRCYGMYDLNDIFYDTPATELISQLTPDFNISDDYFYFSIWGLESTDNPAGVYRDHTDAGEVLDNILDNNYNLYFDDPDFENLILEINSRREDINGEEA